MSDAPADAIAVQPDYVLEDLWAMGLPAPALGPVDPPQDPDGAIAPGQVRWRTCTIPPGVAIGFHATDTVDCVVVLSGRLVLTLEAQEVALDRGDCLIQRNTRHGWRNPGPEPCVLVAAMASTAG